MQEEKVLKVAFRVGRYPSLTETFVSAQIADTAARGHEVTVLADGPEHEIGDSARLPAIDAQHIERHHGVTIRQVEPKRRLAARAFQAAPYRMRRRAAAAAERRLCAEHDIVVCNFGWSGAAVAASIAGQPRRARLVTIFHGDDMSRSVKENGRDFYRRLFAEADLLLPISDFWRRRLLELGAPAEKVHVHRMGIDPSRFAFATPADGGDEGPVEIVTLGRLVEKKGTATVLRALARLRRIAPQLKFRFRIYGDGPLRENLAALSRRLELGGVVEFAGSLPHAHVPEIMATADAFVLPSATAPDGDMEGIPVALMEAMASGVPVISTRHSGIPELIEDGVNGLLIEEHDSGALARRIAALSADHRRRAALAKAGRRTVEQDFNRLRQSARLDALLRGLANASPDVSSLSAGALEKA